MAKDETYVSLIGSSRWRNIRIKKLSNNPLCERCAETGIITAATEVHHVKPVEEGLTFRSKTSLMFDYGNLKSLCHSCHVEVHKELGKQTKQGNVERNGKQVQEAINKFF